MSRAALAGLVDVAADQARAHVPARGRPPVVIDAEHGGLAIEERPVDVGDEQAEILRAEIAHQAHRAEGAADRLGFVRREHAVLGRAEAAVEFERGGDVARAVAVIGRAADAARVEQLAEVGGRGELEDALVLGEERPLVADEGFGRVEVHDQVVAFHLAEVRVHRGEQLHLAVRFPEHVDAGVRLGVVVDDVVQARNVRRQREQRLAVAA